MNDDLQPYGVGTYVVMGMEIENTVEIGIGCTNKIKKRNSSWLHACR